LKIEKGILVNKRMRYNVSIVVLPADLTGHFNHPEKMINER
jgi:hypothetical protein